MLEETSQNMNDDTGSDSRMALTEKQVAHHLGLSVATLRAWRLRGQGPRFAKFGRAVRYMATDVDRFIQASAVEPKDCR